MFECSARYVTSEQIKMKTDVEIEHNKINFNKESNFVERSVIVFISYCKVYIICKTFISFKRINNKISSNTIFNWKCNCATIL